VAMKTYLLFLALNVALVFAWPPSEAHAQKRGASARLVWMGVGGDKVQQGKTVRSDGKPDGRFSLTVQSDRKRGIVHVLLRSCDKRGVLTGRAAWDTDRTRLWVLGVFKRNQALGLGKGKTIDNIRGKARYNLWASKPLGGFKPNTHYCAYVTFGDGMGVSARAAITEPVRAGLTFKGRDRDRVGRERRPYPDGVKDVHFVLRMDSSGRTVELRRMSLIQVDRRGRPVPGHRWDTDKTRNWLLGVDRGPKRLNRRDRPIRNKFTGMAEFHLYASGRKTLKGGERFKVVAQFSNGSPCTALITLPKIQQAKARMTFQGFTADKLGARSPSGPDGKSDGHFRVTLSQASGRTLTGLVIRAIWPGGAAVQGQIWDTRPRGYRMIAVYRGAKRLNPKDRGLKKQKIQGAITYDLYVHNTGWVRPLQNFQVEAIFAGGDRIFGQAKVLKRAAPAGPITTGLRYHGFTTDKVGRFSKAGRDGKKDAKFTFSVNTGGRTLNVTKLELSVSDPKGKTWRKTWDTQPGGNWILGVERGGRRLNTSDRAVRDRVAGRVTYTLWASADSYRFRGRMYSFFTKGGYFTARLYVGGRLAATKTIRLHK
jgi:hypothetical protein